MKDDQTQEKIKNSLKDQDCPVLKLKIPKEEPLPPVPDSNIEEEKNKNRT